MRKVRSAIRPASFEDIRNPAGVIRCGIVLLAILLTVWAQWLAVPGTPFFADEWLRDHFIKLQASSAPDPRILVVDIDEASMNAVGHWPWPRALLADLVEKLLAEYGARGVGLDVVLPEAADAGGDARLGLLAQHGPVVLAQAFDYSASRPTPLREGELAGATRSHGEGGVPATGYIANHPGLARAKNAGNIGFIPDPDGTLRRLPLLTIFDGKQYPALALALVDCCGGGRLTIKQQGLTRVSFKRDWSAYTVVSASDILALRIAPGNVKARLVLVGSTALGLGDRVTTPLAAIRPGLGVQAAMLSTLLDRQDGLTPAPWPGRLLACAFAALAALVANYALPRLSAAAAVALLVASSLAWLLIAYAVSIHDPDFSATGPLASNLFLLAFAVPYQWHVAQRKSRHLLGTLRQYVAREVVEQLLRSDVEDPLAPRQLDVTTLIADLEGYTTHVESLPVEEAAKLTRDFLDCLTGPVIDRQGTLDKYTGDGLVAFWGAPLPNPEHADLALDAALAMLARVRALSQARIQSGNPPLRVRIGIESGLAMAGDFGTSFRSIYTAVGDSVNTASRLENAARDFPFDVIVGAGTVARARRHQFIVLGERLLRGKEKSTKLFTFTPPMDVVIETKQTGAGAASLPSAP
jgi:adenylate cyclase